MNEGRKEGRKEGRNEVCCVDGALGTLIERFAETVYSRIRIAVITQLSRHNRRASCIHGHVLV